MSILISIALLILHCFSTILCLNSNGYVSYCPCMGRFGNQANHFLGALAFSKGINRTLVLPPWVEYRYGEIKSIQVPFDTYFRVDTLSQYLTVITMENFMKSIAPKIWPANKRISFCYTQRSGEIENSCNAKSGNPFGPFWDTFGVEFVGSEFYGPLNYDAQNLIMMEKWKQKYPPELWPVLAFTGAPAAFPVQDGNQILHKYLEWNDDFINRSRLFIKKNMSGGGFLGIHLRNGQDWVKACQHVRDSPTLFAAPQCVGYKNERGPLTLSMCLPQKTDIIKYCKMSRHKQPKKLEQLAMSRLGDWVALQAELQMVPIAILAQRNIDGAQIMLSKSVNSIRSYLEYNVPWMLHDLLASETIKTLSELLEKTKHSLGFRPSMGKFVSQMNVIVKMAEVLFTKNLTVVSIDNIPKMLRSVFYTKLYMLSGLVYLNLGSLSGGWKTADMEESVIQALKELHCLRYLWINYDCTDNILKCIVENCKKLEKLDVSSSKSITNESIRIISMLKFLKSIQLYRTFVTLEGFAKLLINCKSLEDIGRCDEIGRVLEYIDLTNSEAAPLQLKTFVSRYATNNHLQLTVEMCPFIRSMTVFHNSLQNDLMVLIGLKDLCELKLLSCDFYADQIKQLLQVKGCNITHLHLEHVDQIDLNALMYISQMCPLLESLTFYNCTLIQHTSLHTKNLEILPFRNLKNFTCVATCTDEQLLFILANCLNIDFLHVGTAVQLTDDFVFKILDKNPLIHLRELRIMQSDFLTMTSIERILESCMSLEILVEFESWSLLTESDRDYIRNYIKVNNLNVDTAPIRRYET